MRLSVALALGAFVMGADAHGIAGNRFFPGTLTFDDPAVADELIVPNFSASTYPVGPGDSVHDQTYAFSFGRLLTPDLAFQADSAWKQWSRRDQPRQRGFDSTAVGFKARLYENDPHEALLSVSQRPNTVHEKGISVAIVARPGAPAQPPAAISAVTVGLRSSRLRFAIN